MIACQRAARLAAEEQEHPVLPAALTEIRDCHAGGDKLACQKPKEEEDFLARHPSWLRKVIQGDFDLTRDEQADMTQCNFPVVFGEANDAYIELLKRYPGRLREYRKLQKKLAIESVLAQLPSVTAGRPREDTLAQEANELKQAGMSQSEIARELNRRYPGRIDRKGNLRAITAESVRKMLARRRGSTPDKT